MMIGERLLLVEWAIHDIVAAQALDGDRTTATARVVSAADGFRVRSRYAKPSSSC